VMAPKDEAELQHMLKTAIYCGSPSVFRYPRGDGWEVELPKELIMLPIGKAEVVKNGNDILLLAIGSMVYPSIKASEILELNGISTAVINARFVKPLDKKLILSFAMRIGRIITIEEHAVSCGFGSAITEMLVQSGELENVQIRHIGLPDKFIEHGDRKILLTKYGLTPENIAQSVVNMLDYNEEELIKKQQPVSSL